MQTIITHTIKKTNHRSPFSCVTLCQGLQDHWLQLWLLRAWFKECNHCPATTSQNLPWNVKNVIQGCFKYWRDNNIPLLFLEKVLASGRLHGSLQTPPSSRFFPLLKCERRRPILYLYYFILKHTHTHTRSLWGERTSSTSENWWTTNFHEGFSADTLERQIE